MHPDWGVHFLASPETGRVALFARLPLGLYVRLRAVVALMTPLRLVWR
jgi:hypothetical protein